MTTPDRETPAHAATDVLPSVLFGRVWEIAPSTHLHPGQWFITTTYGDILNKAGVWIAGDSLLGDEGFPSQAAAIEAVRQFAERELPAVGSVSYYERQLELMRQHANTLREQLAAAEREVANERASGGQVLQEALDHAREGWAKHAGAQAEVIALRLERDQARAEVERLKAASTPSTADNQKPKEEIS